MPGFVNAGKSEFMSEFTVKGAFAETEYWNLL